MRFYAIRRKHDGAFLPLRKGKRGQTATEPSLTEPPRLFISPGAARQALRWWADGVHYMVRSGGVNYFGEADYDEELHVTPAPERKIEDMEVVKVQLRVKPFSRAERVQAIERSTHVRQQDLICGKSYMGPRSQRYGRSEIRRLDKILHPPGFAAMACFTELSHDNQQRQITLKAFASWAVRMM